MHPREGCEWKSFLTILQGLQNLVGIKKIGTGQPDSGR